MTYAEQKEQAREKAINFITAQINGDLNFELLDLQTK